MDSTSLTVTLSEEVIFADNANYAITFTLVGLAADRFLIAYYNGTSTSSDGVQFGPLSVLAGRVVDGQIELGLQGGQVAELPNNVAFRVTATRVSDASAVIVFGELSNNLGVTSVLASVEEQHQGEDVVEVVLLGSVHQVTSGGSFAGIQMGVLMDLDVAAVGALASGETLGDDSQRPAVKFAVLYSDFSNSAKLTLSLGMASVGTSRGMHFLLILCVRACR